MADKTLCDTCGVEIEAAHYGICDECCYDEWDDRDDALFEGGECDCDDGCEICDAY